MGYGLLREQERLVIATGETSDFGSALSPQPIAASSP
jgi:hypothetical protein